MDPYIVYYPEIMFAHFALRPRSKQPAPFRSFTSLNHAKVGKKRATTKNNTTNHLAKKSSLTSHSLDFFSNK